MENIYKKGVKTVQWGNNSLFNEGAETTKLLIYIM